jgi:hypothetical protein
LGVAQTLYISSIVREKKKKKKFKITSSMRVGELLLPLEGRFTQPSHRLKHSSHVWQKQPHTPHRVLLPPAKTSPPATSKAGGFSRLRTCAGEKI